MTAEIDLTSVAATIARYFRQGVFHPALRDFVQQDFPALTVAEFNKAADIAWTSLQSDPAHGSVLATLLDLAGEIERLPVDVLVAGSGENRLLLRQRADQLREHLAGIIARAQA